MNPAQSRGHRPQVAVFGRVPRPGRVKTRLARAVGETRAADLYAAFLADTLAACRPVAPGGNWLFIAPEADLADPLAAAAERLPADVLPPPERRCVQQGRDLGDRMAAALERLLAHGPAVITGSDAPDLPGGTVVGAFGELTRADLVLGPAADGGYYLIGVRRPPGDLLAGIAWSSGEERARTVARARARGWSVALLQPWRDVDDGADLEALAERLARAEAAGRPVAPRTRRRILGEPPIGG